MIVINPSTRQFNIPGSDLVFGVESDNGAERKYFQCPRYVGNNVDVASSFVRINYRNANGEVDAHMVEDLTIDGDNVLFSWGLHPKVTMYKGQISFVLCVTGPDLKVKWHTTIGKGQVLEGLEPENEHIVESTEDVIAQLITMVEAQTEAVEKTGAEQIVAVKTATATATAGAVAEIEAKRSNSLASIPGDYTALSNAVDDIARGKSPGIVCEAEGTVVAVSDASDMSLQGMRLFGRSTQNGVPTPDAPVEIVSVENPVLRVCGKNLLPYPYPQTSKVESGVTFVDNGDGSITANGTATATMGFWFIARQDNFVLPAGSYVLCPFDVPTGTHIDVAVSDDNLTWYGVASATTAPSTFNLSRNVYISVRWYVPEKAVLNNATMRAMLCKEGVDLAYERPGAHKKFSINRTLYGIPVQTGGNYTDSNGQQWICDEVDLERGVYVQRTGKHIVDDSVIFTLSSYSTQDYNSFYHFPSNFPVSLNGPSINTHLPVFGDDVWGNHLHFAAGLTNKAFYYYVPKAQFPNAESWKNFTVDQYNIGTPVTILYVLETPFESSLSEAELAAYRALHSNKPTTTIINSSGAHMAVAYTADTKLYIDNKISALISGA